MSPSPALPLEVCEFIIDAVDKLKLELEPSMHVLEFISERVRALRACALTCRGWLPRARMHLQTCRPEFTTVLSTPHHLASLVDALRQTPHDAAVELTGGTLVVAPTFGGDQTWVSRMPYELGPLLLRRSGLMELRLFQVDLSVVGTSLFKFYKSLPLIQTTQLFVDNIQYSHLSQFARVVSILDPLIARCHGWFPQEHRVRAGRDPNRSVAFRGNQIQSLDVPVVWADLAHCDLWRFHTPHLLELTLCTRWPNSRFTLEDGDNTFRSIPKLFSLVPATRVEIQDVCNVHYYSATPPKLSGSEPNTLEIDMQADAYRRLGLPFVVDIIAQVMPVTIWYLSIKITVDTQPSHDDVTAPDHWSVIDDALVRIDASELKEVKVEFAHPYCWKLDSNEEWSTSRRFLPRAQQRGVVLRYREDWEAGDESDTE
ncbi:hypothetical protein EIP91_000263 [Steccherinum ochraceum]|uniref:F-box domain-containing protein n=1 Tax=Steccherinum ochraceum TaxID=92696 RepID=A0A4R0RJN5_9APHY|nr:hypothetical protein EIP91_000263 [Steccherinum ochraceum]